MADDALAFVARVVVHGRPEHVLEFGGGVSTRVIERAATQYGGCHISVVENDREYAAITARQTGSRVRVQFAPLVARRVRGKYLPHYDLRPNRFASGKPADFVLIDGPPAVLGGRQGILHQTLTFCRPGTLVLLDDAARDQEAETLRIWEEVLGDRIEVSVLPGFERGLASIIIRNPGTNEQEQAAGQLVGAGRPQGGAA